MKGSIAADPKTKTRIVKPTQSQGPPRIYTQPPARGRPAPPSETPSSVAPSVYARVPMTAGNYPASVTGVGKLSKDWTPQMIDNLMMEWYPK